MRNNVFVKPTIYRNVQMRSRTEARAAAWLESFGWEWLYEPESLVAGVQYTPDFYLPSIDTLIEVKPAIFASELTRAKRRLIERLGKQFALVAPGHANSFFVFDFFGFLDPCDPNAPGEPFGWHSTAPDCDYRAIYIDNNGGRYPQNYIYMSAGCKLRHKFGRECPCTN